MNGSLDEAFGEIYEMYAGKIYRYILQLCNNPVMAEDILQTTFLKAIESADSFQGKCKVDTWLCRIAKNTWLDECGRAEAKIYPWTRSQRKTGTQSWHRIRMRSAFCNI